MSLYDAVYRFCSKAHRESALQLVGWLCAYEFRTGPSLPFKIWVKDRLRRLLYMAFFAPSALTDYPNDEETENVKALQDAIENVNLERICAKLEPVDALFNSTLTIPDPIVHFRIPLQVLEAIIRKASMAIAQVGLNMEMCQLPAHVANLTVDGSNLVPCLPPTPDHFLSAEPLAEYRIEPTFHSSAVPAPTNSTAQEEEARHAFSNPVSAQNYTERDYQLLCAQHMRAECVRDTERQFGDVLMRIGLAILWANIHRLSDVERAELHELSTSLGPPPSSGNDGSGGGSNVTSASGIDPMAGQQQQQQQQQQQFQQQFQQQPSQPTQPLLRNPYAFSKAKMQQQQQQQQQQPTSSFGTTMTASGHPSAFVTPAMSSSVPMAPLRLLPGQGGFSVPASSNPAPAGPAQQNQSTQQSTYTRAVRDVLPYDPRSYFDVLANALLTANDLAAAIQSVPLDMPYEQCMEMVSFRPARASDIASVAIDMSRLTPTDFVPRPTADADAAAPVDTNMIGGNGGDVDGTINPESNIATRWQELNENYDLPNFSVYGDYRPFLLRRMVEYSNIRDLYELLVALPTPNEAVTRTCIHRRPDQRAPQYWYVSGTPRLNSQGVVEIVGGIGPFFSFLSAFETAFNMARTLAPSLPRTTIRVPKSVLKRLWLSIASIPIRKNSPFAYNNRSQPFPTYSRSTASNRPSPLS